MKNLNANDLLMGRVVLITGSTSGIGLGMAEAFAAEGATLMINGIAAPERVESLVASLCSQSNAPVHYHGADMSKPLEIAELIAHTEQTLGRIDVLINNAGIQHVAPLETFPTDRWDAVMAINLSAPFHTIKAALPGMRARGFGRIINLASAHGLVASAHKAAYVAAKHGLIGLTKVVALETAQSPITCNAICPGWVLTPLVQQQVEARAAQEGVSVEVAKSRLLLEKQPSGEFVTPEQLAGLALFLCGPAADQVRGVAWNIDGGWVAQ
jgi:3-hydroxybutyrate dehydrogenase